MNNTSVQYNKKEALAGNQEELNNWNNNELTPICYENIVRENKGYEQRGYNYVNGD